MRTRSNHARTSGSVRDNTSVIFAVISIIPALLFCFLLTKRNLMGDKDIVLTFGAVLAVSVTGYLIARRMAGGIATLSETLDEGEPERILELKTKLKTKEVHEIADFFGGIVGRLEDITRELERRVQQLSTLNEVTILASKLLYLDELLEVVLSKAMDTVKAEIGSVLLTDQDDEAFRLVAQRGLGPEFGRGAEQSINESIVKEVLRTGNAMLVTDIETDPRCMKRPDPKYGSPSFLSVPLKVKEKVIGVLNMAKKENGTIFSKDDLEFVTTLFGQIGFAVENARLYDEARRLGLDLQEKIQKLQSAQEQLIRSERLSATGELIAGVAHELNNPLTGVIGYAELLMTVDCPEDIRQHVAKISTQAVRCQKIVRNLLSFARQHRPELTPVDINETIEEALTLREYEMSVDNIEIVRQLADDLPKTMADYHRLQQVFVNIINNSYQSMKSMEKGTLTVESGLSNGSIVIKISDTGPGIPEEDLPRVFEPFFTTKERGEGTGLGLSLCFGIIRQHEGTISAANKRRGGTIFTIELPVRSGESPSLS